MSVDAVIAAGGDVDDVLRGVVAELVAGGCAWAGILFVEEGELVLGPEAGTQDPSRRTTRPVRWGDVEVAQLVADGGEEAELERVAGLIGELCLVGWDTAGVPWDPAA